MAALPGGAGEDEEAGEKSGKADSARAEETVSQLSLTAILARLGALSLGISRWSTNQEVVHCISSLQSVTMGEVVADGRQQQFGGDGCQPHPQELPHAPLFLQYTNHRFHHGLALQVRAASFETT
jgi:hypothetical protein